MLLWENGRLLSGPRYHADGADFCIAHAGNYRVVLEKPIQYVPSASEPKQQETVRVQTALTVLPVNPDKLLAIEHKLAAEVTKTMSKPLYLSRIRRDLNMQQNDNIPPTRDSGDDPNTPTNRVWLLCLMLVAVVAVAAVAYTLLHR